MEPTPEPLSPPDAAGPSTLSPKHVAKHGLLLYHNLNKLDRWGGGGFGLSTLVKLAGWAGLIAVIGALVVKLKVVEQQLDPVSHGVDALCSELENARTELKEQARRDRSELEGARSDAAALREAVRASATAHAQAGAALTDADRTTRALADRLASELERAKQVGARADNVASDLGTFEDAVAAARARLTDSQTAATTSWGGLGDDLQAARTRAQTLDHSITGVDVTPVQTDLSHVDAQARALELALQSATLEAQTLDRALQERIDQEHRLAAAEMAAHKEKENVKEREKESAPLPSALPSAAKVVTAAGAPSTPHSVAAALPPASH